MENDAYGRCTNTILRAFGVHVKEMVLDGLGVIHVALEIWRWQFVDVGQSMVFGFY